MIKYLFVSYRDWALKAYKELFLDIPLIKSNEDLNSFLLIHKNVEYIFFVGWLFG